MGLFLFYILKTVNIQRSAWSISIRSGCAAGEIFQFVTLKVYRWFLSRAEPLLMSIGSVWGCAVSRTQERAVLPGRLQRLAHMGSWAGELPRRETRCIFQRNGTRIYEFGPRAGGIAARGEETSALHPEDRGKWQEQLSAQFERSRTTTCSFVFCCLTER